MQKGKPNYEKANIAANEHVLLASQATKGLSIDVWGHIRNETDISLCTYGRARTKYRIPAYWFGSVDAFIVEMGGRYIIFYNEKVATKQRITWSVTHELGHFYMGHELDFKNITEELYEIQELEADAFAAQVLMPVQIIQELIKRGAELKPDNLVRWFDVSKHAAQTRIGKLSRMPRRSVYDSSSSYDDHILLKYNDSIDEILPKYGEDYNYIEEDLMMQKERDAWFK